LKNQKSRLGDISRRVKVQIPRSTSCLYQRTTADFLRTFRYWKAKIEYIKTKGKALNTQQNRRCKTVWKEKVAIIATSSFLIWQGGFSLFPVVLLAVLQVFQTGDLY
jgi:hypothetical protein